MNWFKENKFLAGLIGVTLVIGAIIVFLGLGASSDLEEVKEEIEAKDGSLKDMKSLNPFPTADHAAKKRDNLRDLLADGEKTREQILAFRPENVANIPIAEFQSNLAKSVEEVSAKFPPIEGNKSLPDRFNLGFEEYLGRSPRENATGVLDYQRRAIDWLLSELASSGKTQLKSIFRQELPLEKGQDWSGAEPEAKGNKNRRRPKSKRNRGSRGKGSAVNSTMEVAHRMPLEIIFKASEPATRKFLASVADSEEFFFETRLWRVVNPSPIPKKSTKPVKEKSAFDGIDLDGGAGDSAPEAVEILNHVSGGDDLTVFLRLDLLLFQEDKTFPEVK